VNKIINKLVVGTNVVCFNRVQLDNSWVDIETKLRVFD